MNLRIDQFEGPIDLLLHLIKENKMDILDINIEEITNQYFKYLEEQEKLNLEVTSEYLVFASELLEIKSKMLLPRNNDDESLEEDDPREELVNRLLEYQAYKEVTAELKDRELLRQDIHTKLPSNMSEYADDTVSITSDISLDDLIDAFQKFLDRKKLSKPLSTKVVNNEITVASRRYEIKNVLKKKKRVSFFELFPILTKEYVVATFLAILEMAKSRELMIIQEKSFDDIVCEVVK